MGKVVAERIKHFNDIERLAVAGDKKWERGLTLFCKPFIAAAIRFFESTQKSAARTWIEGK